MTAPILKLEHEDARGAIYSITLDGDKELILLHSKKGSLRGGHSHDVNEINVLLTGKMKYLKERGEGTYKYTETLNGGTASYNHIGEYHLAEFLEDSWVLEWKINTSKGKWKNIDHAAWRERVKENATTGDRVTP